MKNLLKLILSIGTIALSCAQNPHHSKHIVRIRINEFPDTFIPLNTQSTESDLILNRIYESLEKLSFDSNEVLPWAGHLESVRDSAGYKLYRYRIRDEAHWANGEEISSLDIECTLKIMNLPDLNNEFSRLHFSFIQGINLLPEISVFEIIAIGSAEDLRTRVGQFFILPRHIFDPQGILNDISVSDIKEHGSNLTKDHRVIEFQNFFDSREFEENLAKWGGSGQYSIWQWNTGRNVLLNKNENWWGNNSTEEHLRAIPETIEYRVISDESAALLALKNEEIDVLTDISPAVFDELQNSHNHEGRFHYLTPVSYQFYFMGFNTRNPGLGLHLRRTLSHVVPYDEIIDIAALGFGHRTVGPMNPVDTLYYNENVNIAQFDVNKASDLLLNAGYNLRNNGWYDADGNKAVFNLLYPTGSSIMQDIALIMKDKFERFGIVLNLESIERSQLFNRAKSHDFEMILSSFRGGPLAHNFAPLFSTEAAKPGGLNFTGFGSEESDNVINQINYAEKKEEKVSALKELQRMLHEEKTMLFLFFEKDRIIVSKKFKNVYGFSRSPGYNVTKFQLANPN